MNGSYWTTTNSIRMLCSDLVGIAAAHHLGNGVPADPKLESASVRWRLVRASIHSRRLQFAFFRSLAMGHRLSRSSHSAPVRTGPMRKRAPWLSDGLSHSIPVEDAFRLVEPTETPATQPEVVQAAQEWPVVDEAPRQYAVDVVAQRQLADPKSHLVVTNGLGRPMLDSGRKFKKCCGS